MVVGKPETAAGGIWPALGVEQGGARFMAIMGDGVAEITKEFNTLGEHCDEQDRERFAYVFGKMASLLEQDNGVKRDVGNEGKTLSDFLNHADARKAKLTTAHVLALRLYTSNSYWRINKSLRDGCTEDNPHPYAATVYFIHDGILKLRLTRAGDATAVRCFWRGLTDMTVAEEFMKQGGTEMGCMSTTEGFDVALKFGQVGVVPNALLLKVQSTSLMSCGADIQWLSMYPEVRETRSLVLPFQHTLTPASLSAWSPHPSGERGAVPAADLPAPRRRAGRRGRLHHHHGAAALLRSARTPIAKTSQDTRPRHKNNEQDQDARPREQDWRLECRLRSRAR